MCRRWRLIARLPGARTRRGAPEAEDVCRSSMLQCCFVAYCPEIGRSETEPAFVGLYGGLLYMDDKYAEAKTLWDRAKDQRFSDEEMTRRQYRPMDPADLKKRRRFEGIIQFTKPNFVLIQRETGPVILAKSTQIDGKPLNKGDKVTFELSFSIKGAFAENLQLM